MKHYIELIDVGMGMPRFVSLDDVPTHDLDVLLHLKPTERKGWITANYECVFIDETFNGMDDEVADWCSKRHGVYVRVVNTHG